MAKTSKRKPAKGPDPHEMLNLLYSLRAEADEIEGAAKEAAERSRDFHRRVDEACILAEKNDPLVQRAVEAVHGDGGKEMWTAIDVFADGRWEASCRRRYTTVDALKEWALCEAMNAADERRHFTIYWPDSMPMPAWVQRLGDGRKGVNDARS